MMRNLRNYFLSGLLVVVPIGITLWIVFGIFSIFDTWYRNLVDRFELYSPLQNKGYWLPEYGMGFFLTIALISLAGFMTQLFIGRKVLNLVDFIFLKIPFVSGIYNTLKQVSESLGGKNRKIFDSVALVEYPRKGLYSLVFVTAKGKQSLPRNESKSMVYVFLATTPNPTSGFFLIVPEEDLIPTNLTVEEGMKLIISGGLVGSVTTTTTKNESI